MSKGLAVECQCCGVKQDVTEMMSEEIFGFTLAQVRRILADYREQVPHAEAVARQLTKCADTRAVMRDLLTRVGMAEPGQVADLQVQIRNFLSELRPM